MDTTSKLKFKQPNMLNHVVIASITTGITHYMKGLWKLNAKF